MNEFLIELQAKLDEAKSKGLINSDIDKIQGQLNKLKIQAEIDPNTISHLVKQLEGVINQKITISNININQESVVKEAQKTGQQIGKITSDEVNNALGKISSKQIGLSFTVKKTDSDEFNRAIDNEIQKLQSAKNQLQSVKYITNTVQEKTEDIFGNEVYQNVEKLTGAVFKYNTQAGEAITKTMKWAQIGTTVDKEGNDVPLMGWVQGLTTYNKSLEETTVKIDTFIEKQKNAVASAQNSLATIESKLHDTGANKTLANTDFNANGLNNQINAVKSAIDLLSNASRDTFSQAQRDVNREINILNNLISTLKNAEYATTSFRTKDITTVKIDEENKLDTFIQKMEQSGHYTDDLKNKVTQLKSDLSNIFDVNSLTNYLNGISNLQTEFQKVDATAKTLEKSVKLKTNIDSEKKTLQLYATELKEAGVLTGDVKAKIQEMFYSLSKVDSQNGLTTWKAELRGVRVETDAILKSFTQLSQKKIDKIQLSIETGDYEFKVESLIAKIQQWTDKNGQARISTVALSTALDNLENASKALSNNNTVANQEALIAAEKELDTQIKKVTNSVKIMNLQYAKDSASGIAQAQERLGKLKTNSTGFEQMTQTIKELDTAIANVGDKASLDSFIDKLRMAEIQLTRVKAEAQAMANINKIQFQVETGGYESKVEALISKTRQWTDETGNVRINTVALSDALNNLTNASNAYSNNKSIANQEALIGAERELDKQVKIVTNSVRTMNAEFAKNSSISSLHQRIQEFYDKNSASHRKWGADLNRMLIETANGAKLTHAQLQQLEKDFIGVANAARQSNKLGKSWFQTLKDGMGSFSYWLSSTFLVMKTIQSIKGGLGTVKQLDTALVDLKKTTTMTNSELEKFYYDSNKVAKQMGVTTEEIINQASAWSRLGFSSGEAATKMAKYSSMFASISPGMDVDKATNGLVSIMKAFDIGNDNPDDVLDEIMSKVNIIGNMLTKSSSAMKEANNTLEETIALETAAVEITRDDDSVGTAFKTKCCLYVQKCA